MRARVVRRPTRTSLFRVRIAMDRGMERERLCLADIVSEDWNTVVLLGLQSVLHANPFTCQHCCWSRCGAHNRTRLHRQTGAAVAGNVSTQCTGILFHPSVGSPASSSSSARECSNKCRYSEPSLDSLASQLHSAPF